MRLLIMSRGLAQYRFKLTEAIATAFQERVQMIASPSPWHESHHLWEVDWEELKKRDGLLLFREIAPVSLSDLFNALLFRWKGRKEGISLNPKSLTLSEVQPDVIAIHEYSKSMILLALYARLAGIPCGVFTEIGRDMPQHGIKPLTRLQHTLAAWLTDFQVANTQGASKPYGAIHRPVYFFPYGVDTQVFLAKETYVAREVVSILVVGQYVPRKGVDLLLKALQIVKQQSKQKFRLRLVGNQSEEWIRKIIAESGLEELVDVIGIRQGEELIEEYQNADIFVLPCRFDTYGVVVVEAASAGLPMLISKHAGAGSVMVQDGINGWIIDPKDLAQCAAHLIRLLEDSHLREEMGRASRAIAEKICVRHQAIGFAAWLDKHYLHNDE